MKKRKLRKFRTEDEERKFWSRVDLSKHFEPKAISLRIPNYILVRLKERANALNIPYQTLMKQYISEGVMEKE